MIGVRLLHAIALINLLILLSDIVYNIVGGLLPLVR